MTMPPLTFPIAQAGAAPIPGLSAAWHKYADVSAPVRGEPVERSTELVAGLERSHFDKLSANGGSQ